MKPLINFFVVHQTNVDDEKLGHDRSLPNVYFHNSTKKPFHFPGLRLYFLDSRILIEKTPFLHFVLLRVRIPSSASFDLD